MKFFKIICVSSLAACSEYTSPLDPELDAVSVPLISRASQEEVANLNYQFRQPPAYIAIAQTNMAELGFLFASNARRLNLSRFGSQRLLYPQITPGVRARVTGGTAVSLNVSQILYDGGAVAAQRFAGETAAISREIEILETLNQEIREDIGHYFEYHKSLETAPALAQFADQLRSLLELAETRMSGGVGAASEVSLFELQLAELETDIAIARSNADLARSHLREHDQQAISVAPASLDLAEDRIPLSVMAALAEREGNRSAVEVAEANLRPQVAAVANGSIDVTTGVPLSDVGLDITVEEPIAFGRNTEARIAREELALSEFNLGEAVREAELEVQQLLQEIGALSAQKRQTSTLADQARERLDSFQDRFLAGDASLTEAVSLIDTLRSSIESEISLKYRILAAELELASLTSSLLPNFSSE